LSDAFRHWLLVGVFALTVFVSASLLFVVQPMVGKMILPHLGGSSSVWTTSMLFFQSVLVAGYVYAHAVAQKMSPRTQVVVHGILVLVAIVTSLPFRDPGTLVHAESNQALWLLVSLLVAIGLPLFVVSSSAPLFQHWFGFTDHPDAEDPYYLYAASNVGSMLALFGYPFLVERLFTVDTQTRIWAWGFGLLAALTAVCGAALFTQKNGEKAEPAPPDRDVEPLTWKRRGWWLLITFIPSSLMLGVTHYLTTDLASVPLLWVLPLGFYLLSFIIVFARVQLYLWAYRAIIPVATLAVLAATYMDLFSMAVLVIAHIWLFFMYAIFFHGQLAEDRPETAHLTEFFIWMSVGGALGGVFNALIAPALFDWMFEYYLVLALGIAIIRPSRLLSDETSVLENWGAALALLAAVGMYFWAMQGVTPNIPSSTVGMVIVLLTVVGLGLNFPIAQNPAVAMILLVGCFLHQHVSTANVYKRSFFANYTVYNRTLDGHDTKIFSHGTTQHGIQVLEENWEFAPVGYYHPAGPVGDVFSVIPADRVAVAGLGTGAMAPYIRSSEKMVFFEIDPVVERLAREHFTYLDTCGDRCRVEIGDARKRLEATEPGSYDLLMLDAYSSDSVPTHLLTVGAVELYMSRVDEDGVLLFNVSNRYLDVQGVVGAIADELGYATRTRSYQPSMQEDEDLAYGSTFTIVARDQADLKRLASAPRWKETNRADVVWTDRYTNIVSVFQW